MPNELDQPTDRITGNNIYDKTKVSDVVKYENVSNLQALQRVLYRVAKQDKTRRFHALYDKLTRNDVMWRAWTNVANNNGSPGVDNVSIKDIEETGINEFLEELAKDVRTGKYRPLPLRRVNIPKANKPDELRPLGIPALRDRILMSAAKLVLEPIFEADFMPESYGFRPKRNTHQALEEIRVSANSGAYFVLDADIKSCFDQIDHDALMALIEKRISDRLMLKLLKSWLKAGILEGNQYSKSETGTPQGSPISPLLANIALSVLDETIIKAKTTTGKLIRYADDFVIMCPTMQRAERALIVAQEAIASLGLKIHPTKTKIINIKAGQVGFDFLGFHNHMVRSKKLKGRFYLAKWPSNKAMASIKAKVKEMTNRRYVGMEIETIVNWLNPVLRGWHAYFKHGNSTRKFKELNSYVHQRLALLASDKHGLSGHNWAKRFNYRWMTGLGIFRLKSTFAT